MIGTLYLEELKATMRGQFAWLGAAAMLLAVGGVATVGTQDTWLDGYGVIAYFLVPLAFIPLAAGSIASPRANRFVESVFTAPVERRDWFVAKVLVLLTLAAAYYLALVPMMLVYVWHIGLPLLLKKFLLWTPGILLASVAVGTLVGVLFIGRSLAAPAATGMGIVLAYAGLVPLQELLVAQANGATRTGHLTLGSPAVLLKNGLGFAVVAGIDSGDDDPHVGELHRPRRGFVCDCDVGFPVHARCRNVGSHEPSTMVHHPGRPSDLSVSDDVRRRELRSAGAADQQRAGDSRALFARGSSLAMTSPGGQLPVRCCGTILNRDTWPPFSTDERTPQDLFILLPVDTSQPVRNLSIRIQGEEGLRVTADPALLAAAGDHLETHAYERDLGPAASDGHHVANGWVTRVPVTIEPTSPWDIGGVRYPLSVTASYRVDGDNQVRTLTARAAIDAQIGPAIFEMGAASLVLPLFCLGAAFIRWRRTR